MDGICFQACASLRNVFAEKGGWQKKPRKPSSFILLGVTYDLHFCISKEVCLPLFNACFGLAFFPSTAGDARLCNTQEVLYDIARSWA